MISQSDWLAIAGIAASPLTAIIGFLVGYSAKRPKLRVVGGGCGSNPVGDRDLMITTLQIFNDPRFLGLPVSRESAKVTEARLYDFSLGELVGHGLQWGVDATRDLAVVVTIESGHQARLYLFAKERHADEFFAYHSSSLSHAPPRSPARYTEKKKVFALWLRDVNGRQYKFPLQVRNMDQSVDAHANVGAWYRLRLHFLRP